ncbi:MAG TPA: hypothetical protein PKH50_03235 [bacterium]|nr:hypothetical protein [bacterium]
MKIGNKEIDKNLVIYFAVAIILSGLLGFYGGRFFERNNFGKMVRERQNFRRQLPNGTSKRCPQNFQPENTEPKPTEGKSDENTTDNQDNSTDQEATDNLNTTTDDTNKNQ